MVSGSAVTIKRQSGKVPPSPGAQKALELLDSYKTNIS
jgi:hypothetical protein